MPDIIHIATEAPATGVRAPAPAGRRRFVVGIGSTVVGLAVAAQFGPDWGTGAPARQPAALNISSVPLRLPSPRPVQYTAEDRSEWEVFRHRYITPEGRVIDTGNANISHSEGQGWGLMGAQAANDPVGFARILEWTTHNLQRRPYDCLHAWRYVPGNAVPVSDTNNATDGDLFIAAALARAAVRWNRPDYAAAAEQLGRALLGLVRQAGSRTVLLPGAVGFETADAFTINPSYYAFALFNDLAPLVPSPVWDSLQREGLALILQGRFGRWSLPPDWLRVGRHDGGLSIAAAWPARFSYDAIRVPLHLAWGRMAAAPVFESFHQYWTARRPMPPAWVDLNTSEVASYPASAGMRAVAALVAGAYQHVPVEIPSVNLATDYYAAGLVLLSRFASREGSSA